MLAYLGFLTTAFAFSKDTTSGMKKQRIMCWVSMKAFAEFAEMANLLVSGSSPNSVGTGPATCSPSNIGHSSSQDASSRHGTLSLDKIQQLVYVKYYIYVEKANLSRKTVHTSSEF